MRDITEYIKESIKPLKANHKGIIVFDIDDTLLKVDGSLMRVYKCKPGEPEIALSTNEYAKDPDAENHREWFDYRDFKDEQKVYQSIITGSPMVKNLKILNAYVNAGYDFCFLTARGCEKVIKDALDKFLSISTRKGVMDNIGNAYKKALSHAVNDSYKKYKGENDCDKKANVLKELCKKYTNVVFVDDDKKNIYAARALHLKNLKIIKAWD